MQGLGPLGRPASIALAFLLVIGTESCAVVPVGDSRFGSPDTGQTACYDTDGKITDCANVACPGQDGFYSTGCPSKGRFIDNENGTVTDTCTGLLWTKDNVDIRGKPCRDRCRAIAHCENLTFAGHDDWRLPNLLELQSIVDYGRSRPAIDPVFGALPTSLDTTYWSSTAVAAVPDTAWLVFFDFGRVSSYELEHRNRDGSYVRAVRSSEKAPSGVPTGQTLCYDAKGAVIDCAGDTCAGQDGFYQAGFPSAGRFVEHENGSITDTCAGLMWRQDTADINGDGKVDHEDAPEWCDALAYCENLTVAGHDDWRLPSVRELQSIVEYGRSNPAIDPVFGALATSPDRAYWSSTSIARFPDFAWLVFFDYGRVSSIGGDRADGYVRAVRDAP